MADLILTLCESCKEDLEVGGFRAKPIVGKTTTEVKKQCDICEQRCGGDLKQFIVSTRKG